MKKNVGIIGCGAIYPRHLEGIAPNNDFNLVSICDVQEELVYSEAKRLSVNPYLDFKEMILNEDINFVVILTPNSLHLDQALFALGNNCDVLIEKPATFSTKSLNQIVSCAKKFNQNAYCVLQVRLNPTVKIVQEALQKNLLGTIRGFSFTQRWQRPLEYFSGWRGSPSIGGGSLYEVGIHYLDILQLLLGPPKEIISSAVYTTKHKTSQIEDTVYAILDYGEFGGTIESTIAAEPTNLESSISILGSNGYIKLGGKALNVIESFNFLSFESDKIFKNIMKFNPYNSSPNSYGSYFGSCPNHDELYQNINKFKLEETTNVISMIEKIYLASNIVY